MKKLSIIFLLCTLFCSLTSWAGQAEPVRKVKLSLKNGDNVEYRTDQIEKISFGSADPAEELTITIDEIGKTYFKFSISTGNKQYIFTALETGYLKQFDDGENYLLAMFGHIADQDGTYEWADGDYFEFEDITVAPGRDYTVLAAIYPGEGQAPDKIYRVDLTTLAEDQSESSLVITLSEITSDSVTVKAVPDPNVSSYVVYVREQSWVNDVLENYGEAVLQSTVLRAAELDMARLYAGTSEDVWSDLTPGTDYSCIVVIEDMDGKYKTDIYNFTTSN